MARLKLQEIFLGKIDAYNEFLEYGNDVCQKLFIDFPTFNKDYLINGSKYYILGDKGTGKTMLLKFIDSSISKEIDKSSSVFIRFKKDFDEEERRKLNRANKINEELIESDLSDATDNVLAWKVYLIKTVISQIRKTECYIFAQDKTWNMLLQLINAVYSEDESKSFIKKIIPKVKQGNIELNFKDLAKLHLDLEWCNAEKTKATFNSVAKKLVELYSSLNVISTYKLYLLIDELELSLKKSKQYERDVCLIRDLIIAIEWLCELSKLNQYPVYAIAAIRNEVLRTFHSKGFEINKPITDFGVKISWQQRGGDIYDNPLIKMLERRIIASEENYKIDEKENIWKKYFASMVNNRPIVNYIIEQSWNKPRDVIRLFSIMQTMYGQKDFFDQSLFDGVRQQYSEESWIEFEEELIANYSDREIEAIKLALIGIKLPFTLQEFEKEIELKLDAYSVMSELNKIKTIDILKDLYELGVVGNYGDVARFAFKQNEHLVPTIPFTIHYPLINFFNASFKRKNNRKKQRKY